MKKVIIALLLLNISLLAYEVENISVKFTAFKTYAKKGVNATFDDVAYQKVSADTIVKMLTNSHVDINTTHVNSGNKARDAKLVTSFFNIQGVKHIKAKIIDVREKMLIVEIQMNETTLNIPMLYTVSDSSVLANGTIDLADFMMIPSLKSINKACYDLHQGKTWQDVDISFEMDYK